MEQLTLPRKITFRMIRRSVRKNVRIHTLFGKRLRGCRFNLFIRQCTRHIRRRNGVVISDNGKGLAVILPIASEKQQRKSLQRWSLLLLPLKRIGAISRFHRRTKAFMPKEPHLLLMLLVSDEERNGMSRIIELRDELFQLSDVMQLPVYVRTSSRNTCGLFESFGFTTYGRVPIPNRDEYMYFLKR